MNPTKLYLELSSKDETHHHASLTTEDGRKLAESAFEYRLNAMIIPTESEQFNSRRGNLTERWEWIHAFGERLYQKVFSQEMHTIVQQAIQDTKWLQFVVRIDGDANRLAQVPWERGETKCP